MYQENCQLKTTLLDYSTDRIVSVGCTLKIFAPPKAEDFTPQKCKIFYSYKLYVHLYLKVYIREHDSFRISFSFSASFLMVFVEPGAAPPVHAKINGTKLLCSTSRIIC